MQSLTIQTSDGLSLVATRFEPGPRDGRPGRPAARAVILAPALGVPQTFYQRYAQWLADQACVVYTFDWRGMGQSAPASLKGYRAKLTDWALLDAPAMMSAVAQAHPGLPLSWFGHSMGGILYGLMPQHPAVDRVVTLGSGSGYAPHLARPLRYTMGFFWHVLVPVSVRLNGYFAGRRLRAVGDLPRGVVAQWRRWCQHPDFIASEGPHIKAAYASVKTPITVVMVADDEMATKRGIKAVHAHYTQAALRWVTLKPRELGVKAIGHFHFFHPKAGPRVWSVSLPWLGA
ncbi:MAG: alpha/beta fold hydrolase [Burkholderiales bacterium]|nr:alpha/beta fold hydrolase [Burkholderiales bacterium]